MSERRKPPNAGKGRVKGVPNKATADVRQMISFIAHARADKVIEWLDEGAKKDPLGAVNAYTRLIEYHIPKLSRTELSTGSDTLKVEIVDPTRRDNSAAK